MRDIFIVFIIVVAMMTAVPAHSEDTQGRLNLDQFHGGAIGSSLLYFQEESNARLSLVNAIQKFESSNTIKAGSGGSISLGIGVEPVWLKTQIYSPHSEAKAYRLSIETPWLDNIDSYLVSDGQVLAHIAGGDAFAFPERPMPMRFYAFEAELRPGMTELYIRVETKGPMAIPVNVYSVEAAQNKEVSTAYQYGILYGIMGALALYNLILYVMIRQNEYGLYALYLIGFIFNSLSYTGQLHTLYTVDHGALFQDWVDVCLMITYSVLGLHFARNVLATETYAPRLDKFTYWLANLIPVGILLGVLTNQLFFSLILSFTFNTTFAVLFIVLGYVALKNNIRSAGLFLISSVTAATCIGLSTAAVGGIVPYNDFTFKAIEVGMAFEAILLAVLLAQRFRLAQRDKLVAEQYARVDDLTGLNNRRGFNESSSRIWQLMIREKRELSILLLDIDKFKSINDQFGHAAGDRVLVTVAKCLVASSRKGDLIARWGGEEFIILLPETNLEHALLHAEKLRKAVEDLFVHINQQLIKTSISIGVSGTEAGRYGDVELSSTKIETIINKADLALFKAKEGGRNAVSRHVVGSTA